MDAVTYNQDLGFLEAKINQLKSLDTDTLEPIVALIHRPSTPPNQAINHELSKVLPIGIGLGLLLGFLAAYLKHSMEKLRNKNTIN